MKKYNITYEYSTTNKNILGLITLSNITMITGMTLIAASLILFFVAAGSVPANDPSQINMILVTLSIFLFILGTPLCIIAYIVKTRAEDMFYDTIEFICQESDLYRKGKIEAEQQKLKEQRERECRAKQLLKIVSSIESSDPEETKIEAIASCLEKIDKKCK